MLIEQETFRRSHSVAESLAMSDQTPPVVLDEWLQTRLDSPAQQWLTERCQRIAQGEIRDLMLGFGLVARKVPRVPLQLSESEQQQAAQARPGWQASHWSLPDAARVRLILAIPAESAETLVSVLDRLFSAGEMQELIALYQGLPLYPFPEAHVLRCGEGIRTNMGSVFQAVAQRNPYPSEYLPEGMWNQLVLKCLFVEVQLAPVVGLEARKNPALTRMLCDYAHERWAASRVVSPELWRCVEPAHDPSTLADLQRVLSSDVLADRQAAALALHASSLPEAAELLATQPELTAIIENGELNWEVLTV